MMTKKDEDKLLDEVEKRFQTLMIGAISRVEKSFGYLWNHGNKPESETQEAFKQKWDNLRTELLNHGNNQIRLAINTIEDYLDGSNKFSYQYNFKINNKNNRSK
jgi:hypothetical protein